jgi:hypothetical protein
MPPEPMMLIVLMRSFLTAMGLIIQDCRRIPATAINVLAMLVVSLSKSKQHIENYLRHASDAKIQP